MSTETVAKQKVRVATQWFDACSGCHMSILDMDERLVPLLDHIEFVYGPLVDFKEVPENIDVAIVEGAISNTHDLHVVKQMRANAKILIALGDCAVTSNIPAMRNCFDVKSCMDRAFKENATHNAVHPTADEGVPALLPRVMPVHEVVKVDLYIPGCPPPADAIHAALAGLLEGVVPEEFTLSRFGK